MPPPNIRSRTLNFAINHPPRRLVNKSCDPPFLSPVLFSTNHARNLSLLACNVSRDPSANKQNSTIPRRAHDSPPVVRFPCGFEGWKKTKKGKKKLAFDILQHWPHTSSLPTRNHVSVFRQIIIPARWISGRRSCNRSVIIGCDDSEDGGTDASSRSPIHLLSKNQSLSSFVAREFFNYRLNGW